MFLLALILFFHRFLNDASLANIRKGFLPSSNWRSMLVFVSEPQEYVYKPYVETFLSDCFWQFQTPRNHCSKVELVLLGSQVNLPWSVCSC